MIEGYNSKNATVTSLLERYDFHFLPILNPDGYEFSFAEEKVSSYRAASKNFETFIMIPSFVIIH